MGAQCLPVPYRSHHDTHWRRFWHHHGPKVALGLIVLLLLAVVALLMWFMTDMRFRSRSASAVPNLPCVLVSGQHPALAQQGFHGAVHHQLGQRV
jgi:hypothetical protein